MSEITIIYILLAMAFLCIIWLLFERDRIVKKTNALDRITDRHAEFLLNHLNKIIKHDKEIGEIYAKLENLDTATNYVGGHLKEQCERIDSELSDRENDICDLQNRVEHLENLMEQDNENQTI